MLRKVMFLLDNGLLNGGTNNACHVHEFNFVFRSIWQALFDSDRILRTLRAKAGVANRIEFMDIVNKHIWFFHEPRWIY